MKIDHCRMCGKADGEVKYLDRWLCLRCWSRLSISTGAKEDELRAKIGLAPRKRFQEKQERLGKQKKQEKVVCVGQENGTLQRSELSPIRLPRSHGPW